MLKKLLVSLCILLVVGAVVSGIVIVNNNLKIKEYKSMLVSLPYGFTYTAHTGCMGTKDNSLESIEAAVENGAHIVEFDLNFTKDGEPVLAHDKPKGGEVTLDEAFAKISGYEKIKVNVDIKSTAALEKVKPIAEKYGLQDRIFYTGVHDEFLEAVKSNGGGVPYYLNVDVKSESKHTQEYLDSLVEKVKLSGAVGINFNTDNATKQLVDTFHANGLLVSIWTVDNDVDIYRVLSYAPDNITTRKPDKLSEAVKLTDK